MRTFLLACLLWAGASHAGMPISSGVPADPDASARLIVSRDRDAPNACDLQLSVDQRVVVALPLGESVTLDVPSGERLVVVSPAREGLCAEIQLVSSQSLLLRPGETRRYQAVYQTDRLFLAPQQ